jgi:hypothetical protein
MVIVLDVNPNHRKVFAMESGLATGVLDRLDQRNAAVSLVTFGSLNGGPRGLRTRKGTIDRRAARN